NVPQRIPAILIAGCVALFCGIFAAAMGEVRPAPDKITRQKDAAELARLEAHAQVTGTELRDSLLVNRDRAELKEHSRSKTREATLVDGHTRSVGPKTDSASQEAKRQLKAWRGTSA